MASEIGSDVIIAGAGPVGLLLALRLGQAGINTIVLESQKKLLPTIRAMVYMPIVLNIFRKLDIFDTTITQSYPNYSGVSWRDIDGNELAHLDIDSGNPYEFGGLLIIGQKRMSQLILKEIAKYPTVQVRFGEKVIDIVDDAMNQDGVKVTAQKRLKTNQIGSPPPAGTLKHYRAKYVVGADGANSSVRQLLGIVYEGFTYDNWKMIGTDVQYDFIGHQGFSPINFIVDPVEWCAIAYTGEDEFGLDSGPGAAVWRVAYSEDPDLPDDTESIVERARRRVGRFIKTGDGKDGKGIFKVTRAEPYILQQRLASEGRKGRVLLAGDALHCNNPIGGLGLTTGICDAFCYGNAIVRVLKHGESDTLLTTCAQSRRHAFEQVTNEKSMENLARLQSDESPDVEDRLEFFEKLKTDPTFHVQVKKGWDSIMEVTFEK